MQNIIFFGSAFTLLIVSNIQNVDCNLLSSTRNEMRSTSPRSFTTTFEGFFPLIDKDYLSKSIKYSEFGKRISLSMYRYYMVQHLYARLMLIRGEKDLTDEYEEEYLDYILSYLPLISVELFPYLTTIGDIEINNGDNKIKFEYSSIIWPNDNGDFGRINHNNHWMYMSLPAPRVVAQALREDYRHTIFPLNGILWDLSFDLAPSIPAGYPTANLLGWKPAVTLTLEQQQVLELFGINGHNFDTSYPKFHANRQLLDYIHMVLRKVIRSPELIRVSSYKYNCPAAFTYRRTQLGWLRRYSDHSVSFSRTSRYIDHNIIGKTFPPYDYHIIDRIMSTAFRVNKSSTVHDWCIYDFDNYRNVPQLWVKSRNHIFKVGNIPVDGAIDIPPSMRKH